jgi:hypothetical protein
MGTLCIKAALFSSTDYSPFVGKRQALFPKVKGFSSPQGCAAGGLRFDQTNGTMNEDHFEARKECD